MEILAWVALIMSIAAVWSTRVTRSEQIRLQSRLDRLKRRLSEQDAGVPSGGIAVDRPKTQEGSASKVVESPGTLMERDADELGTHDHEKVVPDWLTEANQSPEETPNEPEYIKAVTADSPMSSEADIETEAIDPGHIGTVRPKPIAKAKSFEERLGAGVYVWAGGIALMLAGAFLVKYSFDNDLLSVRARLGTAGGFGTVMVLASLWVRSRADKVAASLCGAGVAVMYAAVLSGTAHFDVLNHWVGFALMIAVTATAVGMSLLHGPFVALLGLIGGFVTPALINGVESAWGPTFTYLLLLEIGLAVVTRKQRWFGLSAMTLAMSILSAVVYALFAWDTDSRGWLILFVMGTAVVFVLNSARSAPEHAGPRSAFKVIWLGIGALGSSALLLSMLVAVSGFSTMELTSLGVLGAGAVLLARLDRRYVALAFLAEALCGMMLLAWPLAHEFMEAEINSTLYWRVAAGYGVVFALGGFLCLWRNTRPKAFAWMSAGSAIGFVILTHIGGSRILDLDWWVVYAGGAGLLIAAMFAVWRSRTKHDGWVVDAYALTAAALGTLAIWFGLDHPWVAVAWAGLALTVCALDRGLGLPRLIYATGWLSAGCVLMLTVPGPTGYVMPMRLVTNTMLLHYGFPTVCFALIAWLYRQHTLWVARVLSQALALVTAVVAVSLQIRLGFHRDDLWAQPTGLIEWATLISLWLMVSFGVLKWLASDAVGGLRKAATGIGGVGLIASPLYLLLHANPLLIQIELGDWYVVNGLLYAYGLPCLLTAMLAGVIPKEAKPFRQAAGVVSFALLFALVTLQVRHGFVGSQMAWSGSVHVTLNEWATYGVALLILSLAMCWVGRRRDTELLVLPAAAMGVLGLVAAVLGPVLLDNPLFNMADVGSVRGFNWLLYIYGVPCMLAAAMTHKVPAKLWPFKQIAVGVSLVMLFALVSFEIRQGFVGADLMLDTHPISSAENYSYSLGWVLMALVLLAGGLVTGSASLRYGSLAVMLVAVCKVALDTAQLRDLWRVLSLLGLGLSLIVLGYVYQRYVFRRPVAKDDALKSMTANESPALIDE